MTLSRNLAVLLVLACLVTGAAGCRSLNPTAEQLVVRELREQEDYIYELEDQLDECETTLHSLRRQNESLKRELGRDSATGEAGSGRSERGSILKRSREEGLFPNLRRKNTKSATPPAEPQIEMGDESTTPSDGPQLGPPAGGTGGTADEAAYQGPVLDQRPAKLVINSRLSGGMNHDPRAPHSQGLLVVFEPRNAQNQLVAPQGDLAIVAIDPERPGMSGRVGRWDFAADEAAKTYRKTLFGKGYHLELPWPGNPPQSSRLEVHVRLTLPDGTQVRTESLVPVKAPDRLAERGAAAVRGPLLTRDRGSGNRVLDRLAAPSAAPKTVSRELPPATDAQMARRPPDWSPYR